MAAEHRTERGFDRLVNFSDAVVAIAITLLVLPLTELVSDAQEEGAFDIVVGNGPAFLAFTVTFVVTAMFWLIHQKVFEYLGGYDLTLAWLNMAWLFLIVLLPFGSGLLDQNGFDDGTGLVYCWTLAGLSLVLGLIGWHARRTPRLLAVGVTAEQLRSNRPWVFGGYLLALGLFSLWFPHVTQWGMFGLIFLGRFAHDAPDAVATAARP